MIAVVMDFSGCRDVIEAAVWSIKHIRQLGQRTTTAGAYPRHPLAHHHVITSTALQQPALRRPRTQEALESRRSVAVEPAEARSIGRIADCRLMVDLRVEEVSEGEA